MRGMKAQLLALRSQQATSFIRKEGEKILHEGGLLPDMVDPNGNWSLSATNQWDKEEMEWLENAPATELVTTFAQIPVPMLHMGVVAELILHDNANRARAFTQELIKQSPQAKAGLTRYFGEPFVTELLSDDEPEKHVTGSRPVTQS